MRNSRSSSDSLCRTLQNPRLRDLVQSSHRSRFLARVEVAKPRGLLIVWTAGGYRVKGLPSNFGEVPIVVLKSVKQVKPGWIPSSEPDAISLWRWRGNIARAA